MSVPDTRRRWGMTVVFVLAIGVGAAAWLAGTRVQSPAQAAARAAPPEPSLVTAAVEQRVLASTVIARGDVQPTATFAVDGPAAAAGTGGDATLSGVVTGLWVATGDEVAAGARIVEVSGRPVFVFAGETPVYRSMRPGMSGPDVVQLQAGLAGLGCAAGDSGIYDDATKTCVEQLYTDAGYAAVRGSATEIADLATAETAAADARDELSAAEAALLAAQQPAPPADVVAVERRVARAERAADSALIDGGSAIEEAWAAFDARLVALNAALAGADPSAGAGGGGDGSPEVGGGAGGGGAAGVAERQAAWTAALAARADVDTAARRARAAHADAADGVAAAADELAVLLAPPDVAAEELVVTQRRAAAERAERQLAELTAASGAIVPLGEVVFVSELPVRVASVSTGVGSDGASGGPGAGGGAGSGGDGALVTLASPTLQATVSLPASSRPLVHDGMEIVLLDEVSGETVVGTIASITDRPLSQSNATPAHLATVDAVLPDAWAGRNVRATLTAAATEGEVLVVPAAAVSSSAGGETRVRVERADRTLDTVTVHVGLSADGFVEVTPQPGTALQAGDRVVVGR